MPKIDPQTYKIITKSIIRKLYTHKCWGKGHMLVERFKHGLPSHFKGDVNYVIKDLIKNQVILPYGKTKHGFAIYLNIKKKDIIEKIISG
ncbi:MAG: hypothetical protein KKG60_01650 [Nanoarchaeota archaeon]|nr:hypothetical protein [Nanoarchaeota archaeon]